MREKYKSKNRPSLPEAPPPSEPEAAAPEPPPDPYDMALFAAELGGNVPELEMHGFTRDWAKNQLERFLHHAFMEGHEAVKIIHGKGGGWLRQMVKEYLTDLQRRGVLIAKFRGSTNLDEHNAVTYAALYPKK